VTSNPSLPSSAAEDAKPGDKGKKKKGKKEKTPKEKKVKTPKEKSSEESDSKAKRKSLLSLILPSKSSDRTSKNLTSTDRTSKNLTTDSDHTPKGSDVEGKKGKKKIKPPKSSKKKEKKQKQKVDPRVDLDKTPTAEPPPELVISPSEEVKDFDAKRDLAICSVFYSVEADGRHKTAGGSGTRRTLPLAPKANGEDLSDSDESHISISTLHRRRGENLDERVARRLKKMQAKQQKQAEHKRLRMAQEIQRQLEEVEVRQRELEERGIQVEKALRGDGPDEDLDESQLMSEWFSLVHEKNALLRYESELNVRAKELELEDRQARLELDFRERSRLPDKKPLGPSNRSKSEKSEVEIAAEGHLLEELLDVVEQRNNLVAMLEEDRLREQKEDDELKEIMEQKGFVLSPMSYDTRRERQNTELEAPLATMAL